MSKQYHLFISHSWTYPDAYSGLIRLLNAAPFFYFSDYSVPTDDPIHTCGTDEELRCAIENQIRPCGVVLILAGVYATHSKWINKEIAMAKKCKKPIIAIEPWASEKTSQAVKNAADRIVKWNTSSIVGTIKELN